MAHQNSYVRMTPLTGAAGRITYISSPEEQEHLMGVYDSSVQSYWIELAEHCQAMAKHSQTKRACEAREAHGDLDNRLAIIFKDRDDELAKLISERIKAITGTENVVAIHWNKAMTNYHWHAVMSENKEINEVEYGAVLRQNTYYNSRNQKVNKKEAVDPDTKEIRPGYRMLEKGQRKETIKRFGGKENLRDPRVKEAIQESIVEFQNNILGEDKYQVYKNDGLHMRTQHVGNKVTGEKKEAIEKKNEYVREYNSLVDQALVLNQNLPEEEQQQTLDKLKENRNLINDYNKLQDWDNWMYAIRAMVSEVRTIVRELIERIQRLRRKERSFEDKIKSAQQKAEVHNKARTIKKKKTRDIER